MLETLGLVFIVLIISITSFCYGCFIVSRQLLKTKDRDVRQKYLDAWGIK
jgi:hypothetical protein